MVVTLREPTRLIYSDSTDEFTQRLLESAAGDGPTARALTQATARVTALVKGDQGLVVASRVREVASGGRTRSVTPETRRITRAAGVGILLGTSLAAAVVGVTHTTVRQDPVTIESVEPRPETSVKRVSHAAVRKQPPVAATPAASSTAGNLPVASPASTNSGAVVRPRQGVVEGPDPEPSGVEAREHRKHSKTQPESGISGRPASDDFVGTASASRSNQRSQTGPARLSNNDLGQELALLDTVRAALSAGNPRSALRTLDDTAKLPHRVLGPEATVLRVRALVALNRTTEARRLVETFVAQTPNSPVNPVLLDLVARFEKL